MATNELVYSVGLVWDKVNFNGLNASINKSISIMATATAAAVAASGAMFALGKSYADTTDNLIKTSERLSTTTRDMQKLTFAAEDNGASMADVESSLSSLAKAKENMLRGSGDFEAFGRLGVNPTQYSNTADLLMDISDSVKDMDSQQAIDLMSRVGISPQMLQTMQKGSDGLRSLGMEAEELGIISDKKMLQSSQTFMSGWQRASSIFKGVMNKVGSNLLDSTINPALKAFNKFASKHMKTISKVLTDIFLALAKAAEFIFALISRMTVTFKNVVNLFGGMENAAKALGAVLLILKRRMIAAFIIPLAIATALYLVIDDVSKGLLDQDSYFKDLIDTMGSVEGAVAALLATYIALKVAITAASNASKAANLSGGATKSKAANLSGGATKSKGLFNKVMGAALPAVAVYEAVKYAGNKLYENAPTQSEKMAVFDNKKALAPQQNITIEVNGVNDPKAVATTVRDILMQESNKSAQRAGY